MASVMPAPPSPPQHSPRPGHPSSPDLPGGSSRDKLGYRFHPICKPQTGAYLTLSLLQCARLEQDKEGFPGTVGVPCLLPGSIVTMLITNTLCS